MGVPNSTPSIRLSSILDFSQAQEKIDKTEQKLRQNKMWTETLS